MDRVVRLPVGEEPVVVEVSAATVDISVVLPTYNEQDNVGPLCQEIETVLEQYGRSYEIVFVDDGSRDETVVRLRALAERNPRIRIVVFRRNFGQTAAMAAGLEFARGEAIITMDADGQNDPHDIPALVERMESGYDLVCGWRHERKDGFWLRRLPSVIANRLISATTEVGLHDYGCTLKCFRRGVAKNITLYGEMHRFIPAIASWMGVNIAEQKVNHRERTAGQSKYGISRTFRVVLDLITVKFLLSYSSRPLQLFGGIGMICAGLGFLMSTIMIIQRVFFEVALSDRPLFLLAVLLIFMGLQFITVGLLAEVQMRTYHETQRKPTYTVREIVN